MREVLNAIFYVLSTGCQWKALPKDLPPKSTAHYYFMLWDWDGTLERIHEASMSRPANRGTRGEPDGRDHRQSDRQGRSKGGSALDPQGLTRARKSRAASATSSSTRSASCSACSLPANIQDRDGARALLHEARRRFPFVERIFADAGISRTENGCYGDRIRIA